jgi:glutamate racemase
MEIELWEYLKTTKKPIVLYGMGNGADKIIKVLEEKGLVNTDNSEKSAQFFVSDTPDNFEKIASLFLSKDMNNCAKRINIEKY